MEAGLKRNGDRIEAHEPEDDSNESPQVVDFLALLKRRRS